MNTTRGTLELARNLHAHSFCIRTCKKPTIPLPALQSLPRAPYISRDSREHPLHAPKHNFVYMPNRWFSTFYKGCMDVCVVVQIYKQQSSRGSPQFKHFDRIITAIHLDNFLLPRAFLLYIFCLYSPLNTTFAMQNNSVGTFNLTMLLIFKVYLLVSKCLGRATIISAPNIYSGEWKI